jgi:chemotaxis protein MotA
MDIGSILGTIMGLGFIIMSIVEGGSLLSFVDVAAVFIVIGGSFSAIFVRFPLHKVLSLGKIAIKVYFTKTFHFNETIAEIIRLADMARKESILSLEKVEVTDPFLSKGIRMAVDGKDPDTIKTIMATELKFMQKRHGEGRAIIEGLGEAAPSFGMVGTLTGLVLMLGNLSDPTMIGPSMAVALVCTFYGAFLANFLFIPMSGKLKARSEEESINKQIIITGVLSILAGENPRVIKEKLESFLPLSMRVADEEMETGK